jgi:hypothetical protein
MAKKLKRGGHQEEGKRLSSGGAANKSSTNYDKIHPTFSIRCDHKDFCLSLCDKDEKSAFADQLHKLSTQTWQQLKSIGRHAMGYETITRSNLKVEIPDSVPKDANIIAFRFSALKPMVGYRDKDTFHILWLDRAFNLYKH